MDKLDIEILKILQQDARTSISEIGHKINMSVSAVGERIKKLERSNVIDQYTTIIDSKAFNKELTAIMFISLDNPKYIDNFQKFVHSEPDILECHYITGNYDYLVRIVTNNPTTLGMILNKVKGVHGISKTLTNVVMDTVKQEYSVQPTNQ